MRIIDVDEPLNYFTDLGKDNSFGDWGRLVGVKLEHVINVLETTTTIKTKEVKYFDDDEKAWKIGRVIVDE